MPTTLSTALANYVLLVVALLFLHTRTVSGLQRFTYSLSQARSNLCATSLPQYDIVMFAGGDFYKAGPVVSAVVDVFRFSNGTFSTTALSQPRTSLSCTSLAATSVESAGLALFAGGCVNDPIFGIAQTAVVDIYDAVADAWTKAALSQARYNLAATAVADLAIFAGGAGVFFAQAAVDIFDTKTMTWSTARLSIARDLLAATTIGPLAIFAGGNRVGMDDPFDTVDILDSRTLQWSTAKLSFVRSGLSAATVGTKSIFIGSNVAYWAEVFDYRNSSCCWTTLDLGFVVIKPASASIFEAALFGGGWMRKGPSVSDFFTETSHVSIFIDCPTGHVLSPSPANRCTPCLSPGTYSAAIRSCAPCEKGSYNPRSLQSACFACTAGSFCPSTGMINATKCLVGRYCPLPGLVKPKPCAGGNFCPSQGLVKMVTCPRGFYCPRINLAQPIICPNGTTCTSTGLTAFTTCTPGYYCRDPSQPPTLCTFGHYCPDAGMFEQILCPAGFTCSAMGLTAPSPCPVGSFCPLGSPQPTPCVPGCYCPQPQLSAPVTCPAGSFCLSSGLSSPALCMRGFFCPAGSIQPKFCAPGQVCPTANASTSLPCPLGRYCPYDSMTTPVSCPAGSFCDTPGLQFPRPCQQRFWCPAENMTKAEACPPGHECPFVQMTEAIRCKPGFAAPAGAVACSYCSFGASSDQSYCLNNNHTCQPGFGFGGFGCVACSPGRYSSGKSECLLCSDLTYTNINASTHCLPCTDGLFCNSTTGLASPRLGFWSFVLPNDRLGQLQTVPCVQPKMCIGADPDSPSITRCDASRLQSPLNVECAQCASGLSEWQNTCMRCDGVHGGMVLLLMLATWSYVLFTHKMSQSSAGLTSIFMSFVQMALLIASNISFTIGISWLNAFGMHTEDIGGGGGWLLSCVGSMTPTGKVWLSLGINFILLAELALTALIHWLLSSRIAACSPFASSSAWLTWPWAPFAYVRTLLALLLYSFTSLTETAISFIDCVDIGPFRVVALRPAVDCRSQQYHALQPVVILVLALCFLLPIALLIWLLRHRKEIQQLSQHHHESDSANTDEIEREQTPNAATFVSLAILFESFKAEKFLFLWTIVVLLRRTIYVVCSTIHSLADRFVALSLVSLFFCLLQSIAQPYRSAISNSLELISTVLLGAISIILVAHPLPVAGDAAALAVAALILLPSVLFIGYLVVVTLCSKGRSAWARMKQQLSSPLLSPRRGLELQSQ